MSKGNAMNYEEANQVLNNVKYGLFEPGYKVTQALIITGDLDTASNFEHKLIQTGFLDDTERNLINPPWTVGPSSSY